MFKPSASTKFTPAGWIVLGWSVLGWSVAVAVVAALGVTGFASWRAHSGSATAKAPAPSAEQRSRVLAGLGTLPLAFEANQGQTDPQVKYMARGNGYTVFLTANETVFAMQSPSDGAISRVASKRGLVANKAASKAITKTAAIHMHLVGGKAQAQIAAGSQLPGVTNYYIGGDRSKWQTGVKQYAGVAYHDVYPGVNMAFHGEQRQLEFDFTVAAGADPASINLGFSGARRIATDASGNLLLSSASGDVVLHKPVAYQERNGRRQIVAAEFVQGSHNQVGFALGPYDRSRELVIDPALSYSTYLGGLGEDEAFGIAVDTSGNVYVAGQTASFDFPAHTGTVSTVGGFDAFVSKLNSSGSSIVFTTLIGGSSDDSALGIAVNSSAAYVVGTTSSSAISFPSTVTLGPGGGQDAFVASLNSTTGAAVYVTRVGGTGTESGNAIAVDASGDAYIGGETDSTNFKTVSPIQSSNAGADDGFVAKLNPAGSAFLFSTYLGGSSGDLVTGIALDSSKNAYVTGITVSSDFPFTTGAFQTAQSGTGDNGFVTEIKADGSAKIYSTYLGGTSTNDALGIAVDSAGEAYVAGATNSSNFPTVNPAQPSNAGGLDVFVSKFNATGSALLFSTYYGGTLDETGTGIALDSFGDAYVTGRTASTTFPVPGSFQGALSGTSDAFVTEFSNTGFVVYSSFLGGTGNENSIAGNTALGALGAVAVDSSSHAYLAGDTDSTTSFPLTAPLACCGAFAGGLADGFVAKVGAAPADFSVAVSPTSVSTTSGQTTSAVTVTVSSVNSSYGQPVTLSCGSLPSKAVCHFSPAPLTPGASAVTSSLTIATNGASSSSMLAPSTNRGMGMLYAMFLPIGGVALLGVRNNSRRKRLLGFLLLAVILMGLLVLPACGGDGGGGGGGNNTPPGSYNITVSGQGGGVTHSAPLALTVN